MRRLGVRFPDTGDVRRCCACSTRLHEGTPADVRIPAEAIGLTRELAARPTTRKSRIAAALMRLHTTRAPRPTRPDGRLVPLDEQDRTQCGQRA